MECTTTSKAWEAVQEIELVYKRKVKLSDRPVIKKYEDTFNVFSQLWDQDKIQLQEEFKILFLNCAGAVIGVYHLATGGITGVLADPRLIFCAALKAAASSIIVGHNHPSGNLVPSKQDIGLTKKLRDAGALLEIELMDHIIISTEGFFSFSKEGLL